jgi:hypothetical protein
MNAKTIYCTGLLTGALIVASIGAATNPTVRSGPLQTGDFIQMKIDRAAVSEDASATASGDVIAVDGKWVTLQTRFQGGVQRTRQINLDYVLEIHTREMRKADEAGWSEKK